MASLLAAALLVAGGLQAGAARGPVPEPVELLKAGRYAEAEQEARRALAAAVSAHGGDSLESAVARDRLLGVLLRTAALRAPEPVDLARASLRIKERLLSERDPGLALTLALLGRVLSHAAEHEEAAAVLDRAWEIASGGREEDGDLTGRIRYYQGLLAMQSGDLEAARERLEEALKIRRAAHGPRSLEVADALSVLGAVRKKQGDLDAARGLLEEAVGILTKILPEGHPGLADPMNNLGNLLRAAGEYARAREMLLEALRIKKLTLEEDNPLLGVIHHNLAVVEGFLGDHEAALSHSRAALEIWERTLPPDHPWIAAGTDVLGARLLEAGDYTAGRRALERSLEARRRALGDGHVEVGMSLINLGGLRALLGDLPAAEEAYREAMEIIEAAAGPGDIMLAEALHDLAEVLEARHRPGEAGRAMERAVRIAREGLEADHPTVAAFEIALADLRLSQGNVAEARRLVAGASAALEGREDVAPGALADGLATRARVERMSGEPKQAEELLLRAISLREGPAGARSPVLVEDVRDLARLYLQMGRSDEALESALRAEALSRRRFLETAPVLAGTEALRLQAARVTGTGAAISALLAASDPGPGEVKRVWDTVLRSRAMVLDVQARRRERIAGAGGREVRALAEGLEGARRRLAHLVVKGPDPSAPEAFAQALQEAERRVEALDRELAEKSRLFRRWSAERRSGWEDVASALPSGAALVSFVKFRRIPPPAASAPEGAARTAAAGTEGSVIPSYAAFVLSESRGQARLVDLGSASDLEELVSRWRREASTDPRAAGSPALSGVRVLEAGRRLREAAWDPLESHLRGARLVQVVPDGTLHQVSFAALPAAGGGYLLESAPPVHYLSAERDLTGEAPAPGTGRGLLVFGGPDYDSPRAPERIAAAGAPAAREGPGSGFRGETPSCADFRELRFERLPGALSEAREIEAIWSRRAEAGGATPGGVLRRTGPEAREEEFKRLAAGRRVIHLATHGFSVHGPCGATGGPPTGEESPPSPELVDNPLLLTGLALSGANRRRPGPGGEDGILTAEEITSLDLSAVEWVVLSACETGAGKVMDGEGVLGLRRAFHIAGVRTLVMTLWAVEDEATRAWMRGLYEARLSGLSTVESVRRASLRWIRDRREAGRTDHPFYWGAFVAAGDWR